MGIFPEKVIHQVLAALDAERVLRRIDYRPEMIQATASTVKAFCPIHKETIFRTLIVNPHDRTYRCTNHHCDGREGGDLIDLYARACVLGYEQALLELAGAFGIPIDLTLTEQYLKTSLEVGWNYLEMGVYGEAEEEFARILRFKSDCVPALDGLAQVYEATQQSERQRTAQTQLAATLAATERFEEAAGLLRSLTSEAPEDEATRRLYIECLERMGAQVQATEESLALARDLAAHGEVDRALEIYRAAEGQNHTNTDVTVCLIQLLVGSGRLEEAVAEHLKHGERHLTEGERGLALERFEAALDLDPSREELYVRLAQIVAEAGPSAPSNDEWLARVTRRLEGLLAARIHGALGLALDALEQAYAEQPPVQSLRADLEEARGNNDQALELRLQSIDCYQLSGDREAALAVLEKTMNGRTGNIALLSRKANLLRELGRDAQAVPVFLEIVKLFANSDEFENAAAVYQTVIDLEPEVLGHRAAQFDLYLKQGIKPIIVQKALALAEAYASRGEPGRANQLLEKAQSVAPESMELLTRHAEMLEQDGRRGEAAEQYLAVGKLHLAQKAADRARHALENALRCVPEHIEARETLADTLVTQELNLQAIGIYADLAEFYLRDEKGAAVSRIAFKVLALEPDHLPALLMLAKAYRLLGEIDRQLAAQMRIVKIYLQGQSYTRATEICEEILASREDYTPALEQLIAITEASRQSGQSIKYLWKLAQVHARAGRRSQEQGILEQIISRDPVHPGANYRQIEIVMQWGTPRALTDAVNQMIRRHEQVGVVDEAIHILEDLRHTSNPKPEVFAGLARLLRAQGDEVGLKNALRTQAELLGRLMRDEDALEVWNQLATLEADDPSVLRTRIEIMLRNNMSDPLIEEYRRLALVLIEQGRNQEAEVALIEVINLCPRDPAAHEMLITIFIKNHDYARALEEITEAAGQLLEEGHYLEAIHVYERAFEFEPQRIDIWRKIIAVRQRMNDIDGAIEAYNQIMDCLEAKGAGTDFEQAASEAIRLQPGNWIIRRRLAEFYAAQSRGPEAESTLMTLAVAQIEAGQLEEADQTLVRILEINPASVPARAHRAEMMARQGKTDEALSEFMSLTGSLARIPAQTTTGGIAGGAFRAGNYEGIKLLKEYTFETFIVGGHNSFAHATAMAVSRAPARNYNPLFLYSDVGMGKTHLCHAIAHHIIAHHPELKVLYTTTEEFVAELIDAIQANEISRFRNRHRLTDVLIVDDVQFLSSKERAQEEFFHIFNSHHQAGKQVILTSDRPPKDISPLEKRLKSRFGAGIIVDIQPPDLETRIAILRNELQVRARSEVLSDEVLAFVAERVESNIRELKGALNQLLAWQDIEGSHIDLVMARQILAHNLTKY